MRLRTTRERIRVGALAMAAALMPTVGIGAAVNLPKAVGDGPGLCVLIGCGSQSSASLAADLAASGRMLVHGIALDDASAARARRAITAKGVDGLATVETLTLKPLPYRDHLANVVAVVDAKAAAAAGLDIKDALRVVAPGGRLCVYENGQWKVTVKQRPAGMDEWTHAAHGPDGNRVSADTLVKFPVGLRWHDGLPLNIMNSKRNANAWSNTRGLGVAGGRCFVLSTSVRENLGATYRSGHGLDQYVTARDAYNGLFLWRRKVGALYYGGLYLTNRAPFVASADAVYTTTDKGKLVALDAATGQVTRTFDTAHVPGRILLDRGIVVAATWKDGTQVGAKGGVDRRCMVFDVVDGTVEAFDVANGERLWRVDKLATSLRSADGRLYMLQRTGADPREKMGARKLKEGETAPVRPKQTVVALDLRTGKPIWQVGSDVLGPKDQLRLDVVGLGVVTVSHNNGVKTSILSGKDGKRLAEVKVASYAGILDGAIHIGGAKYDPKTGKKMPGRGFSLGRTICTPRYMVNGILVSSRGCRYLDHGKWVTYGGARGGCLFAAIAANGAFYTAQNWCCCAPGQVPGFISFGPIAPPPAVEEMQRAPVVVKGPAYGQLAGKTGAADWPMYRHDAQRSSATPADAPAKLDVLWQAKIAPPAGDGPVEASWRDSLAGPLTAPVVAGGIMVAAATHRHQVVALDATSGKEIWRTTVGGRIDSPPTLHNGVCLFGSHDGTVYALATKDGRLAWKMLTRPRQDRMVSYGQLESPWPVIGTVLVSDGLAYASAGRTSESDGGIAVRAFEPATGKIVWSRALPAARGGQERRQNDLMLKVGPAVQLMVARMDARTGELGKNPTRAYQIALRQWRSKCWRAKRAKKPLPEKPTAPDEIAPATGLEGLICWTWTRLGNRRFQSMTLGNVAGDMICWDDRVVLTSRGDRQVRAVHRDKVGRIGDKAAPKSTKWALNLPVGSQVTSMAVCRNAVVVGGGTYGKAPKAGTGFVWVVSFDKGQKIAEHKLAAPLAYNGLAVANGKVYATVANGAAVCLGTK